MKKAIIEKIKKYGFEFFTIFIGVFAAFVLDNWNDERKDANTETKILQEIDKGLKQDIKDLDVNLKGHQAGLRSVHFFGALLLGKTKSNDSLAFHKFNLLRDFISVQNVSGYETLKSKGLEIITNDSLRSEILSLYENDYNSLRKLEEDYSEVQFFETYHHDINTILVPNFIFDKNGIPVAMSSPLRVSENEKKILISDLGSIATNRNFMINNYKQVKSNIQNLQNHIEKELKKLD